MSSDWVPNDISLADPYIYKHKRFDMLLGADLFFDLLSEEQALRSNSTKYCLWLASVRNL